jgi:hypothetical protein
VFLLKFFIFWFNLSLSKLILVGKMNWSLRCSHTPSLDRGFPRSATNSPPNLNQRFLKVKNKAQTIFEDLPKPQKHINRAVCGGKQAIKDLALAKHTIKRMQSHRLSIKIKAWGKGCC